MSEEKRTTECGKKKKISGPGQKFASDEMKDTGETNLNDGKAPELDSSSKQDSVKATNEKTSRYFMKMKKIGGFDLKMNDSHEMYLILINSQIL